MPARIDFVIPRPVPSLNTMLRTHYRERSQEQSVWDWHVFAAWQNRRKYVFVNPVRIVYTLSFRSNRKRDLDNYIGGTKYVTDAIRRSFLTRDDAEWLREISVRFAQGPDQTKVDIQEMETSEGK